MTSPRGILVCAVVFGMAAGLSAQTTTSTREAGTAQVTTSEITGEVVLVDGNILLARMLPNGQYRMFNTQPGVKATVDGKPKTLKELTPGTILTATTTTTTQPITVRTTTVTNGTVWYVQNRYVILTLENGENREYNLPEGFTFTSAGKQATVEDLRKGMKVSATKIVSEPTAEISSKTLVTGRSPK